MPLLCELGRDQVAEQAIAAATRSIGNNAPAHYELARYEARGAGRLAQAAGDARTVEAFKSRSLATLKRAVNLGFCDRVDREPEAQVPPLCLAR